MSIAAGTRIGTLFKFPEHASRALARIGEIAPGELINCLFKEVQSPTLILNFPIPVKTKLREHALHFIGATGAHASRVKILDPQ